MDRCINKSLAIIVRATGESTTQILFNQLTRQLTSADCLHLIDKEECFEDKLKRGFELGIQEGKDFTVFIDADILLRRDAINKIKKLVEKLEDTDLGFGLRLWDRFYEQPKFRGLHIYRTAFLEKAIPFVPAHNLQLRPESYTKQKMEEEGHAWRNGISLYVAGIHDFFQKPDDIYYKFLVRSKRSEQDLDQLKQKFRSDRDTDFKIALQGIEDGEEMTEVTNNKLLYKNTSSRLLELSQESIYNSQSIDVMVLKRLIKYYRFNRLFWGSI
ncbi:MAG: hypothetical protein ACOH2D_06775 [Gelidibacter sp.]